MSNVGVHIKKKTKFKGNVKKAEVQWVHTRNVLIWSYDCSQHPIETGDNQRLGNREIFVVPKRELDGNEALHSNSQQTEDWDLQKFTMQRRFVW